MFAVQGPRDQRTPTLAPLPPWEEVLFPGMALHPAIMASVELVHLLMVTGWMRRRSCRLRGVVAGGGQSGADGSGGALTDTAANPEDIAEGEEVVSPFISAAVASATTAAAPDSTDGGSVGSVSLEGPQGNKVLIKVGDELEYRWGSQNRWYRCSLPLVQGEGASKEVELEFPTLKEKKA